MATRRGDTLIFSDPPVIASHAAVAVHWAVGVRTAP